MVIKIRTDKLKFYRRKIFDLWNTYKKNKMGILGLFIVGFFVTLAIFAPYIAPYDPYAMGIPRQKPSPEHWLGTNDVGQDILSEVIYGTRTSLTVGLIAAVLTVLVGTIIGLVAGYFGGGVDDLLMRFTDMVLSLPDLALMIVLIAYGGRSIWNIILVIAIVSWTNTARMVRSQVLSLKERSFVEAARAIGAGDTHIILRHILPNVMSIILPLTIMSVVWGILTEAGLAFLGLGDLTIKSWGTILYYAAYRGGFILKAWWWIIPPGLCITFTALGFTLIGYALDEVLNPKLRRI
ncbi:MAG: ABC transporter permease [Candidatus Bathyarchaeaceae archaeon]